MLSLIIHRSTPFRADCSADRAAPCHDDWMYRSFECWTVCPTMTSPAGLSHESTSSRTWGRELSKLWRRDWRRLAGWSEQWNVQWIRTFIRYFLPKIITHVQRQCGELLFTYPQVGTICVKNCVKIKIPQRKLPVPTHAVPPSMPHGPAKGIQRSKRACEMLLPFLIQ